MATYLSIDFDIIMGPTINLYGDFICEGFGIQDLENNIPLLRYASADLQIYNHIINIFINFLFSHEKKKIFFIKNHHEAVEIISKTDENILINIDHHHDIGYMNNRDEKIEKIECGNWVKYLKDNQLILSYCWIKNPNSENIYLEQSDLDKYIDKTYDFYDSFSNILEIIKEIDYLIVCASFDWIPTIYRDLYHTLTNIYNIFYDNKGE